MDVTVTDPIKMPDNYGGYMLYKVNTTTNHPHFSFGNFSVMRRFSDLEWLHNQLSKLCPGCIIPALPEKQVMGKFEEEFIHGRRRAMEKFINRVTKHADLSNARVIVPFLSADDSLLSQTKAELVKEKEAKSSGINVFVMFKKYIK